MNPSSNGPGLLSPLCGQADRGLSAVAASMEVALLACPSLLSQLPGPAEIDGTNKAIPLIREGRGSQRINSLFRHHKHLNITLPSPQGPQAILFGRVLLESLILAVCSASSLGKGHLS